MRIRAEEEEEEEEVILGLRLCSFFWPSPGRHGTKLFTCVNIVSGGHWMVEEEEDNTNRQQSGVDMFPTKNLPHSVRLKRNRTVLLLFSLVGSGPKPVWMR